MGIFNSKKMKMSISALCFCAFVLQGLNAHNWSRPRRFNPFNPNGDRDFFNAMNNNMLWMKKRGFGTWDRIFNQSVNQGLYNHQESPELNSEDDSSDTMKKLMW